MKKLLIVGASVLQLPAIKKAKEMGFYVGTIDFNPDAAGIPFSDEYFNVSTIDIEGVTKTALSFKPDGIMTLATDMPMRSVAGAAKACGLNGIDMETAIRATDKAVMIKAFEENGVEHPWYFTAEDPEQFIKVCDKVTYPCIIKPTDNAGSRGVVLCENKTELENAYAYTKKESRKGAVIIEEYLRGKEVSVEVMVIKGQPHILQITDKLTTGAPHFVEMGHSQPSVIDREDCEKIKDLAVRAVKAIGINAGPAHVEIMLTDKGPKMIELGARMGGDCITTHLVPLSTGIDMVKCTIETACGIVPDINPQFSKGSAIRYFDVPAGILDSAEGLEEAEKTEGIKEISFVKKPGDRITGINNSSDRAGFVIAQADTAQEAVRICEKAIDKIKINVK